MDNDTYFCSSVVFGQDGAQVPEGMMRCRSGLQMHSISFVPSCEWLAKKLEECIAKRYNILQDLLCNLVVSLAMLSNTRASPSVHTFRKQQQQQQHEQQQEEQEEQQQEEQQEQQEQEPSPRFFDKERHYMSKTIVKLQS